MECGFRNHLFSFESLVKEADALSATKRIKPAATLQKILYRGWMLKPNQYTHLYDELLAKNYQLINSPAEYQHCHYLPESYSIIREHTPKTTWLKIEDGRVNYGEVFSKMEMFGNGPVLIKDYVKSQKHYWDTACFIPSAADKDKVKAVVDKFIELQGDDLNEGLVIREFIELNDLAIHSKSGMPLKQEYRLFFLHSQLLGCYDYWEEGDYVINDKPPLELFEHLAKDIKSNFFSMDIAKTKMGEWKIIELGDGQVAGLPDKVDRFEFYKTLKIFLKTT